LLSLSLRCSFLFCIVSLTACADEAVPNACDELSAQNIPLQPGSTERGCARVERTAASESDGLIDPAVLGLCYITQPTLGPAGVYRVRELTYVQESVSDDATPLDGSDAFLVPYVHRTFVYADMELVEAWEEGASERLLAKAYDQGTWPDEPVTTPELVQGEEYLVFPGIHPDDSHTLEFAMTFVERSGSWSSDYFDLPSEYERIRDRLAQARQHMADAGVHRFSTMDERYQALISCPEELRGISFE
jgi:hypothetical protein